MAEEYGKVRKSLLIAIADSIRGKTGKTDKLTLDSMVGEINNINTDSTGGNGHPLIEQFVTDEIVNHVLYTAGAWESSAADPTKLTHNWQDMRTWWKNFSAGGAYIDIDYYPDEDKNVCQYCGVGYFEIIGNFVRLQAGKKYTFSLDYYSPTITTGEYAQPYAPYIGFLVPTNVIKCEPPAYDTAYATHVLPVGEMTDFVSATCSYTPDKTVDVFVGFDLGSTLDGVQSEFILKNIRFTEE